MSNLSPEIWAMLSIFLALSDKGQFFCRKCIENMYRKENQDKETRDGVVLSWRENV